MKKLILCLALAAAGCGGDGDPGTTPPKNYVGAGPFVAGVTTVMAGTNPVEVWYPADRGAEAGKSKDAYDMRDWLLPADRAKIPDQDAPKYPEDAYRDIVASRARRFPVVLFSHGLGGYRMQSTFLMTHLAQWGFVVAAPDHPESGLARIVGGMLPGEDKRVVQMHDALAALMAADTAAGGPLEGRMDFEHIAATGHSMGGGTAHSMASDANIKVWIEYAASNGTTVTPALPALVMSGSEDEVSNLGDAEMAWMRLPAGVGKRFVGIRGAGHLAFADICLIAKDKGGVLKVAMDHGINVPMIVQTLAQDGCGPEDLPVEMAFPLIRHYTVAHVRLAFGLDVAPGLLLDAAGGSAEFGERLFHYQHE